MQKKQKNILLIMSDQQRFDTVSAYKKGDGICRTPNIDLIAQNGMLFNQAFTCTAQCSPARTSLFTGLYPCHHGVTANSGVIKEGTPCLSDYLIAQGYYCGYSGKWHIDDEKGPTEYGFHGKDFLGYAFPGSDFLPGLKFSLPPKTGNPYADYLTENKYEIPNVRNGFMGNNSTNQVQEMYALHDGALETSIEYFVADEGIRLMKEAAKEDKPFFIWANFWGPHSPSLVPEPYYSMYNPDEIPEHPSYKETFKGKPNGHQIIEKLWGLGDYGWKGFQQIAARYYGHCTLIDDMVGKMIEQLKELDLMEDTIIVYTADHGDCLGAHKLIEKGPFMYDEIYKIPMVVLHPDCKEKGTKNDEFVYLHDLTETFMDIAGVKQRKKTDGISMLPMILGEESGNKREEIFCMLDNQFFTANQRMVRTKRHQFTFNSSDIGELYDLEKDPYQLNNVYEDEEYEEVRLELMGLMEWYMKFYDDKVYSWYKRIRGAY